MFEEVGIHAMALNLKSFIVYSLLFLILQRVKKKKIYVRENCIPSWNAILSYIGISMPSPFKNWNPFIFNFTLTRKLKYYTNTLLESAFLFFNSFVLPRTLQIIFISLIVIKINYGPAISIYLLMLCPGQAGGRLRHPSVLVSVTRVLIRATDTFTDAYNVLLMMLNTFANFISTKNIVFHKT